MTPKTLFLSITAPLLPLTAVDLWIQLNIGEWAEKSSPLSLMTRTFIAVDNFVVRYAFVVGVVAWLLGPMLAAALQPIVTPPEAHDLRSHERARSTVSSLGRWLIVTIVLTGLTISLAVLGPVQAFGFSAFLGWSAFVGLVLALAHMYMLQEERRRAGRSRWHSRWLVGLATVLNLVLYPIVSYLLPAAFYFYGRYEVAGCGSIPDATTSE